MAENKVGVIRKGEVIKDQGFVSYKAPEDVSTPNVAKSSVVHGKKKGMGAALRGGNYTSA